MRLRARWVVPVEGPVIEHGEVIVEDTKIAAVRPAASGSAPTTDAIDFGDAVILPGFVNVHAHLDYTALRGLVEDLPMLPWILSLMEYKTQLTEDEWAASALIGVAEAISAGITTIGDCTDSGASVTALARSGVRAIAYQEVFGIAEDEPVEATLANLDRTLQRHRSAVQGTWVTPGVSPHAAYTVRPELMRALVDHTAQTSTPLCIHAAESNEEADLVRSGSGAIAERLKARRIRWSASGTSVIRYLSDLGALTDRTLLVHCVQVSSSDHALLGPSGASIAYCPKSNAKLGNGAAPLTWLMGSVRDPGAATMDRSAFGASRLGLGTDSVVSNNTMDMIEDMRFGALLERARRRSAATPTAADMVTIATLGGARALGLARVVGSLVPGKAADITVVSLRKPGRWPACDPCNALVWSCSADDVAYTMVGGRVLKDRRGLRIPGLAAARRKLRRLSARLARR